MSNETISRTSEPRSNVANEVQLSVDNVSVSFGAEAVLRDVSFQVRRGEFIGLVGQNGSGKTTLLRAMLGLVKPNSGTIKNHHAVIGYVPQRGQLYNGIVPISTLEVVKLGSKGDTTKARDALKSVGMGEYERHRFSELSGGQQQRVVIAKALASDANVLMLDEPTTGVDKASQTEFYNLLRHLHKEGRTIIIVSHDVDSILKLVSRVICLNRAVVYDGTPTLFDSKQHLRGDYNVHFHAERDDV